MQVTHAEARHFIQLRLDAALEPRQQVLLSAHLDRCAECRVYAEQIKSVDRALAAASQAQRQARHIPLSIPMLMEKSHGKLYQSPFLTIRNTMIVLMFAVLGFAAWSFLSDSPPVTPGATYVAIPPVPTPSGQSTSTRVLFEGCKVILYAVQKQDTLAGLARRFSITEEEIIALNDLKNGSLESAELWLPVCNFTPTGTAQGPTTLTRTHTPALSPIISTPGG